MPHWTSKPLDQLRDTIRRYVRERLVPLEARVAEDDRIPDEIVQEMRDLGLFGLTIPEEFGGIGLDMSEEVQIAFELGYNRAQHDQERQSRLSFSAQPLPIILAGD